MDTLGGSSIGKRLLIIFKIVNTDIGLDLQGRPGICTSVHWELERGSGVCCPVVLS